VALHAQAAPPGQGPAPAAPAAQLPPPAETPRTNITPVLGTNSSFFQRNTNFGRPRTDLLTNVGTRTAVPPTTIVAPGLAQPPGTVPGAVPGAAVPGTAVGGTPGAARPGIPAIPGLQVPPTTTTITATSANFSATNIVARGSTNDIPTRMINFQEADLSQIFELYALLTKRTLLKSPQTPANVKVSLRNETPLTIDEGIDALNTILGLNGIAMVPQGEKFIKAVPQAAVGPEVPPFTTNSLNELRDSKAPLAQIVTLKNLLPEEATSLLQPFAQLPNSIIALKGSPVLILRDYSENVKRMIEVLERVDIYVPPEIETVVIPIKYALAGEIASVLSGLGATASSGFGQSAAGAGLGGATGGAFPGSTVGGGIGGGGIGGGGFNRFGGGGGYQGGGYQGGGINRLGTAGTLGGAATGVPGAGGAFSGGSRTGFGNRLNQAVNRAVGAAGGGGAPGEFVLIQNAKIIPDERSNALLVFADRRDLGMISNIIAKLDVVLPQVLIEALIMEVNIGDGRNLGVSLKQNRQNLGDLTTAGGSVPAGGNPFFDPRSITSIVGGTNGQLPSGFSYFGRLNESFEFAVTASANDSRINVLSRPRIVTSTAKPASIFVGETRPYITGSYFSDFTGAGSRSQYAQTQIGISLNVLPIVNQEGLVVMDIQQQISQVGAEVQIDGNNVPTTIDRNANSYVAVHDRDTILLGGFISTTKNKSKNGVPYLKDIPGLGVLFRSSSESVSRVELMVLIRPTVLPTPEAAAVHTAVEKDRHPAIKAAEREVDDYQQKQLERERKEQERLDRRKL
jgi:general secretion pathway protein D